MKFHTSMRDLWSIDRPNVICRCLNLGTVIHGQIFFYLLIELSYLVQTLTHYHQLVIILFACLLFPSCFACSYIILQSNAIYKTGYDKVVSPMITFSTLLSSLCSLLCWKISNFMLIFILFVYLRLINFSQYSKESRCYRHRNKFYPLNSRRLLWKAASHTTTVKQLSDKAAHSNTVQSSERL